MAGALLVPGSLAIITASFEGEEQGRAFGVWASASAATTIIGPFIGGVLVNTISWRMAFLINLPFLLVAYVATVRYVPESRDENASGHFDWAGSLVVALAVGGLAFGTIRGQQSGWGSPEVVVFVRTVRHEVFDLTLVLGRRHLDRILRRYAQHYNEQRPHRGIGLRTPDGAPDREVAPAVPRVRRVDVLGGLIHEYKPVAA